MTGSTNKRWERLGPAAVAGALCLVSAGCWSVVDPQARACFEARERPVSVTVLPVHVVRGRDRIDQDPALARELADFLGEANLLVSAVVEDRTVEFPFQPGMNQAKMLQRSGQGFSREVPALKLDTDYALLVEILSDRDETGLGGVHCYLAEAGGAIADARLSNSHHEVFKAVRPTDREGGLEVAKGMLSAGWARD